ncbi:MAG: hypothetical protein DMD64_11090 [Gemmatimonadetes bacterium]|nr:MAG: hypothetical protein DMD64_11090 [Gemmatimonadota bacterium]
MRPATLDRRVDGRPAGNRDRTIEVAARATCGECPRPRCRATLPTSYRQRP